MAVWSVTALLVQHGGHLLVNFLFRGIFRHIEEGNAAAVEILAAATFAIGMLNAASMTY